VSERQRTRKIVPQAQIDRLRRMHQLDADDPVEVLYDASQAACRVHRVGCTGLPDQHRIQADRHRCPHCDLGRGRSRTRARRAQIVGVESQRSLALLRVYSTWFGLAVPKNVPVDIIDRLNKAVNDGLADSKLNAQLRDITGVPMPGSPADFGQFIAEETEKWATVIKLSGVKSE
jgi:hypothetical protein